MNPVTKLTHWSRNSLRELAIKGTILTCELLSLCPRQGPSIQRSDASQMELLCWLRTVGHLGGLSADMERVSVTAINAQKH